MKIFFIACALFISCFATLASATDLTTLLTQAKAYHEGKLAKIDDMVLEYTGTFNAATGESGNINSVLTRKGELWRMDATIGGDGAETNVNGQTKSTQGMKMETTVLFDGKETWTSVMGMKMKVPNEQALDKMAFTQYWNAPPEGSNLLGEETIDGRACYVVEHPKDEFTEHPTKIWIDKQYFVNVKSDGYASGKHIVSNFSDFKAIDGDYVIPYKAEVYSDDQKTFDMTITRVEVNKGVSNDLFDASKLEGGAMDLDLQKLMKEAGKMKQGQSK